MASVQVAVRVRPFNEREISLDSKCIIRMESNKTIIYNNKANESIFSSGSPIDPHLLRISTADLTQQSLPLPPPQPAIKEFVYDYSYWSFSPNDSNFKSQNDVYNNLGAISVQNAFDGYNTCVCAYGQTGSGKSYSMMGSTNSLEHEGLIPRICKNLFENIKNNSNDNNQKQTTYRAEVSYLEIYNEKVRDLLKSSSSKTNQQQNLKVREHPKTGVYVQDLSQHIVVNYYDIEELLNKGNLNRTTASTQMNDTSSRSHAIFTVKFSQAKLVENNIPSETVSKMNLVDLAGSERADSTGATGLRLKEGSNINKSLLTFINVISTLADLASNESNKKHYIPYRDSILTWLLKDSLGGNSKTFILATISPADINYAETMSTLRYANRAKNIINKPTVNEDPNVKLIRELRGEINRLKTLINPSIIQNPITTSLIEQINQNETKINELTNDFKCKWDKYHSIFEENEGLIIEKLSSNGLNMRTELHPYLVNISNNNLPSLSFHLIKPGRTLFESESNDDLEDQLLNVIKIENCDEILKLYLIRTNDEKCLIDFKIGSLQINENLIQNEAQIELNNGDLIALGQNIYLFNNPLIATNNKQINLIKLLKMSSILNQNKSTIEEQRKQIQELHEQIHLNNTEMMKLKEKAIKEKSNSSAASSTSSTSMNKNLLISQQKDEEEIILNVKNCIDFNDKNDLMTSINNEQEEQSLVESFERNEKLLSDCLKQLTTKTKQTELKSLIFELQNLRLKDKQYESDVRQNRIEIETIIEKTTQKREEKLNELNKKREDVLNNKNLTDLKQKMSLLNNREIELDMQIIDMKSVLNTDQEQVVQLTQQLNNKITYEQFKTVDELIQAESNTIDQFKQQIDLNKKEKSNNHILIETEFQKAKIQMIKNLDSVNPEINILKQQVDNLKTDEQKLKQFLTDCLYENDEEKCLVENELTDLIDQHEQIEEKLDEFKRHNINIVEQNMLEEYKEFKVLKHQDQLEIKQEEDRLQLLVELSAKHLQSLIKQKETTMNRTKTELKQMNSEMVSSNKQLNALLAELEVLEAQRLVEENKIYNSELKLANEFKSELDKLNSKLNKLEVNYHKKLSQNINLRNNIKPKLCNLVGAFQGIRLFEADFTPKNSNQLQTDSIAILSNSSHIYHTASPSLSPTLSPYTKLFVDTNSLNVTIESTRPNSPLLIMTPNRITNSDSGIGSNGSSSPVVDIISNMNFTIKKIVKKTQTQTFNLRFNTCVSNMLGICIEITESVLFGTKSKVIGGDEHFEYLIDIKLNNHSIEHMEHWSIFRRYRKIRQLHDQMCSLYPSLSCLVFPGRLIFNQSEKHLIERQYQLEHYLKCFLEVMLNDSSSPIYFLANSSDLVQSLTSDSLNSICSSSNNSSSVATNSASSFYANNHFLTKSKLCSFCSFFEPTEFDRLYFVNNKQ